MALTDNSRPFHGNAEVHGLEYPEGVRFAEDIALSEAETRVATERYTSPAVAHAGTAERRRSPFLIIVHSANRHGCS